MEKKIEKVGTPGCVEQSFVRLVVTGVVPSLDESARRNSSDKVGRDREGWRKGRQREERVPLDSRG